MRRCLIHLLVLTMLVPSIVGAEATMKRLSHVDDRTVSFGYNPHQVYTVDVHVGYLTQFQFSPKETIVDTGSGLDAEAVWETAQPAPYIFTIKPKIVTGDTNVVFTTRIGSSFRTYMFHLRIRERDSDDADAEPMIWNVKFWYPGTRSAKKARQAATPPVRPDILDTPEDERNYDYHYSGNERLVPGIAFDNGTFTFLRFSPEHDWPLVYAVDMNTGNERLVNTRREGPDVIVEGVYAILVMRYGRKHACIFNAQRVTPKRPRAVRPVLVRSTHATGRTTPHSTGGMSDE